jgi:hypothetical protein
VDALKHRLKSKNQKSYDKKVTELMQQYLVYTERNIPKIPDRPRLSKTLQKIYF